MGWSFPPGHVSSNRARIILCRCTETLDRFCRQLEIKWRGNKLGRHLSPAEFRRLRNYCDAHPASHRCQQISAGTRAEYNPEHRQSRDQEIARRIAAASAWKRDHYGAYIGTAEMIDIERCL